MLNSPWPQYLRSIIISGLRGWDHVEVEFKFPVVAIAGENGSGKSTILQAAASAYSNQMDNSLSFYPSNFFPATAWDTISGVTLNYKIRQGDNEKSYTIRRKTSRWRGLQKRPSRYVIFQDISRILPLDATVGYARIAKQNSMEISSNSLNQEIMEKCIYILGRNYNGVKNARSSADETKEISVADWDGRQYSRFHQGAGEGATIELIPLLLKAPKNSIILIDEVEASLHPRSQRRLIHFLLWLARTRYIQVILTTHSSYVLEELPDEARILLNHGTSGVDVIYGITPNYALNRMDDTANPDIYLFTEDAEATILIKEILRQHGLDLSSIGFVEVGPSNVVETLGNLSERSGLPFKALGVLDADKEIKPGCIKLPGGNAPEKQLYQDILRDSIPQLSSRLGKSDNEVRDALARAITIPGHHHWLIDTERALNFSKTYLWETMCQIWVRECLSDDDILELIGKINSQMQLRN